MQVVFQWPSLLTPSRKECQVTSTDEMVFHRQAQVIERRQLCWQDSSIQ